MPTTKINIGGSSHSIATAPAVNRREVDTTPARKKKRKQGKPELKIQIELIAWARKEFPVQSETLVHFHVGRAGYRPEIGIVKGTPDLFLASPVQIWVDAPEMYHGLWIELKADANHHIAIEQKQALERLARRGYVAVKARGLAEAQFFIDTYLIRPHTIDNEQYIYKQPRQQTRCHHIGNPRGVRW